MKPFNLERAKAGDPIVTKAGEEVRFLLHDPNLNPRGRVLVATQEGNVRLYFEDGEYLDAPDGYDLRMAPIKHQLWARAWMDENKIKWVEHSENPERLNFPNPWIGPAVLIAEWEE